LRFSEVFELLFSGYFRFYCIETHIRIHVFLNFFLNVGEGPPTVASGPLSATFPTLVKISSYATGLQLNFPE